MLEVADPIMTLREDLSRGPIKVVSNRDLDAIISAFTAVNAKGNSYQECVIYVILARLADISSITDVFSASTMPARDRSSLMFSDTAAHAMVSQIEDRINDMDDDIAAAPDRETLARQAGAYVGTLAGAAKAIGQTGSRQQSRRVGQVRGELADKIRISVLQEGDEPTAALLARVAFRELLGIRGKRRPGGGTGGFRADARSDRLASRCRKVCQRYRPRRRGRLGLVGDRIRHQPARGQTPWNAEHRQ